MHYWPILGFDLPFIVDVWVFVFVLNAIIFGLAAYLVEGFGCWGFSAFDWLLALR